MLRTVTYSPAYTLVPTYECFNRCTYCNFRVSPGEESWLSLGEAQHILESLSELGISEILILSGEVHPDHPRRRSWLDRIAALGELALSYGFLPHTNVGPLSFEEMARLKEVNVSMGLMVEQVSGRFLETVHVHAPSKEPRLRLEQLRWAGELRIPFTTGILVGIGETQAETVESLEAIAQIHQSYHHIQEVILQPYSPGSQQTSTLPGFDLTQLPPLVTLARRILPPEITLQIPPNLVNHPHILLSCLDAGATDLGGLSPKDEVNPDYPHPSPPYLQTLLEPHGWHLQPRLPLYPQFDSWLSPKLKRAVQSWREKIPLKV
ncbi:7,8-didemethyl-8-hydroxy-5-deazariboflavin synthase subunit CofG [Roseofilum sp. BLCC_M154]|uniref:7,8-didemethyl-8-hydroxy-5-deazariboflavin synthase n=1 Tax=Roseofilum acuticapitatum BLCC-M154 TaxID=3022444 RepID=A0ABT7ARQ2_9CYAN|nr:7,8-didemethyl-8-hydroxy-5-deazariboflavin synthase subunit CofG [Roseofilum acuticapitatum]MDJ1168758.1 7,8-didemethyl-8-hydroxy-5-deazariboflavin synthase subunit CofG [Roseofilum acuticapitatum BLCC-M154]